MAVFSPKFFSIVLLGGQNPQILNHDFLMHNGVLPAKKEPFKSLFAAKSEEKLPFSKYLSNPLVTTLEYKWISFIVQQERYQIRDSNFSVPSKSPIVHITQKYFGKLLRHTPFHLGGINFHGDIRFSDKRDEEILDKKLGINSQKFLNYFDIPNVQYSTKMNFLWTQDPNYEIELRIDKPKKTTGPSTLNFNFEFLYDGIDNFMKDLDKANEVYDYLKEILMKLEVEIKE